ncbi:hypothetical protein GGS21DRAFT_361491 [Xylaria nigripes]|nr:hypothetical protein GGS21DRAFT_361491 [Xylaria nigripes]
MLTPAFINLISFFYPVGNTPAVSLTQSISPDASADILLLGCGDVRNILFTNHVNHRKMDITCCDNQKAVIARNLLLLSLIIDYDDGHNDSLWNIYYDFYIDKKSLDLLRCQAKKLCELSATTDTWRQSKYGSMLSFCDSVSFANVKKMWELYSKERTGAEASRFKHQFESVLGEARAKQRGGYDCNFRSIIPSNASSTLEHLGILHRHYWIHGNSELNAEIRAAAKHPNPTFLAVSGAIVHYGLDPLSGFHLVTATVPTWSDAPIFDRINKLPQIEKVIATARLEFSSWIASYRKHSSGVNIRFFTGDAISLAHTLQHKRVTGSNTAHWYQDRVGFRPLVLDGPDYASSIAPLDFDVIDTSNLCDHLGSLILLSAASPLLRNQVSSVLYTELLVKNHKTYHEALNNMLCGNIPSLSVLLDLFPVEYWTNVSSSSSVIHERMFDVFLNRTREDGESEGGQMFLRSCWKRPLCMTPSAEPWPESTTIKFDEIELAELLYQVYIYMFRQENLEFNLSNVNIKALLASSQLWYSRASFVSFLRIVQTRVKCDWDQAMSYLLMLIENRSNAPMNMHYFQELLLWLHTMNVFSPDSMRNWYTTTMTREFSHSRITLLDEKWGDLRDWKNIPPVVCVTLKVPRSKLAVLTNMSRLEIGTPHVHCLVHAPGSLASAWMNISQACQFAFGDVSTSGKPFDDSFEVSIVEDEAGWDGTSPLIVVFCVPTFFLLLEPRDAIVAFGIHNSPNTARFVQKLGLSMKIYETSLENSNAVYVTRYGPHQTRFPITTGFARTVSEGPASAGANASLIASVEKQSGHIVSFTGRLDLTGDEYKSALKDGCEVHKSAVSPCEVAIRLGQTTPLILCFPIFVVEASQRVRIARKSSYIEVIAKVAGPSGWVEYPHYMYPIHLQRGKPVNWNVPYLDLRTCPIVDIKHRNKMGWLTHHLSLMMSARERNLRESGKDSCSVGETARLVFKESLYWLFHHFSGVQVRNRNMVFFKSEREGGSDIIIFPSSLRLDLADRVAILDCAVLPLDKTMLPELRPVLPILSTYGGAAVTINDAALQLWRRALPAYVERCRTWTHQKSCVFAKSNTIPLPIESRRLVLCTCGNGHFPPNFISGIPHWRELSKYAVRAAISPAYWAPFADDAYINKDIFHALSNAAGEPPRDACAFCRKKQKDGENLMNCGRCMKAKYCSRTCQRVHWLIHKQICKAGEVGGDKGT